MLRNEETATTARTGDPGQKPWLGREIQVLSAINFANAVGFGIQAPTLPSFGLELGIGSTMIGGIVAAFSLGRMLSNIPSGKFVERFGERSILIGGLVFLTITSVLAGLSMTGWQLLLFRGIGGIGSACYTVAAMALLLRVTPASHRGRAVGIYMGAFYLGATSGPVLGALLSGFSPRVAFFAYAAGVGTSAIIATLALPRLDKSGKKVAAQTAPMRIKDALHSASYRAALAANFATGWGVYGVRVSVLPLFLITVLQENPAWVGIGLAFGAAVQVAFTPVAGFFTDRLGRKIPLALSQLSICTGFLLVLFLPALWSFLACFGFFAAGASLSATSANALAGDVTGGRGGTVMAVTQFASDTGMVAGPVLAGLLAQFLSYNAAFAVSASVAAYGLLSALLIRPNNNKNKEAEPEPT